MVALKNLPMLLHSETIEKNKRKQYYYTKKYRNNKNTTKTYNCLLISKLN